MLRSRGRNIFFFFFFFFFDPDSRTGPPPLARRLDVGALGPSSRPASMSGSPGGRSRRRIRADCGPNGDGPGVGPVQGVAHRGEVVPAVLQLGRRACSEFSGPARDGAAGLAGRGPGATDGRIVRIACGRASLMGLVRNAVQPPPYSFPGRPSGTGGRQRDDRCRRTVVLLLPESHAAHGGQAVHDWHLTVHQDESNSVRR